MQPQTRLACIFCADADWDDRAEMLVCHLKGNVTVSPVLFDVQYAPMKRQMRLYFAGAGNATKKLTRKGEPVKAVMSVLERGLAARRPRPSVSFRE